MLTSVLEVPEPLDRSSEDIFASAVDLIFPEETRNFHGDLGSYVIYRSKYSGNFRLGLAAPENEDGRKLFAHYVWNAGLLMAEFIDTPQLMSDTSTNPWNLQGEIVLELGAGW